LKFKHRGVGAVMGVVVGGPVLSGKERVTGEAEPQSRG
jgi:hypothetical protein